MELIFQVKNQRLYLNTVNQVVADSKGYLTASFTFTDDWDGTVKIAQFTRGTATTNVTINATTGKCAVPQSVLLGEGEFFVSVYGTKDNETVIITANAIRIAVMPSGFVANPGSISQADAAALVAHANAVEAVINNSTTGSGGYAHKIEFTVKNQSMYLTTRGKVVADSQGYLGAKFYFSDDWDGLVKIAQFKRGDLFYSIVLNSNDECVVPWEVLVDEGIFIANVFGNNQQNEPNKIVTVNPVEVYVEKSGLTAGELPDQPTEGIDGQTLYEIRQYTIRAEAAADTATTAAANALRDAQSAGQSVSDASGYASAAASSASAAALSAENAAADATALDTAVTRVETLIDGLAPLNSPAFTGTPTAPTPADGNNSTRIATTAFVRNEIADLLGSAPTTLDTLNELAAALGDDPNFATTMTNELAKKLNLTGGTMTAGLVFNTTGSVPIKTLIKGTSQDIQFYDADNTNRVGTIRATHDTTNKYNRVLLGVHQYGTNNAPTGITLTFDESGTFTTSTSTPQKDSNNGSIATTAFVKTNLADYLPLSGGTMTGNLSLSTILNRQTTDATRVSGGNDITPSSGAMLTLFHKNATNAGWFRIFANDGTFTKKLEGKPDGALTWDNNAIALAKDVLSLTGGTLTGQLLVNKDNTSSANNAGIKMVGAGQNFALSVSNTNVTKGSAPSGTQYWGIDFYGADTDNYNKRIGMIETRLDASNVATTGIFAYDCTTNTNTNTCRITVNVDGNGNAYTSAPTPAKTSNDTNIATTAYVKNNLADYLPLTGGTLTGTITFGTADIINRNADTGYLRLMGGTAYAKGASITLIGQDRGSQPGEFVIRAKSPSAQKDLNGKPDGTLTWAGKSVFHGTITTATNGGYEINSVANFVTMWTRINMAQGTTTTWTFPVALANTYYCRYACNEDGNSVVLSNNTTTSITVQNNSTKNYDNICILIIGTPAS